MPPTHHGKRTVKFLAKYARPVLIRVYPRSSVVKSWIFEQTALTVRLIRAMNLAKFAWSLLFIFPLCASARELYEIRSLSDRDLMRTYTSLLVDACHHSDKSWKTASFDPSAGYWGNGISDGNEGIRAIGEMVFTCGTLLKFSDAFTSSESQEYLRKATAAIRYATATHKTGTQKCPDGKQWGNSWQSAMWAGTLGFGAWLLWDQLAPDLRNGVQRVLASESDRFLAGKPPGGEWLDTKAEENGWNLICISLTANMFPDHPHAAAWNKKAIEYMMNTLSAPQDFQDTGMVDGRAAKDWFSAANVHPDFTLENHGFFHPAYVACSSYFLTQSAMHYTYAKRPIPQAATHHLMDTWRMLQTLILPCGESAYPQGMDWELHGLAFINLFASLGTWQRDPLAARMEEVTLQYMRAWQNMCDGDLAVPGSRLGFTRHAICAEQAAYGFLAHKLFGPPVTELAPQKAVSQAGAVQQHEFIALITHRTTDKFFSVSWKNKIMAMLIPIGQGHDANPYFTVPIANGLIGSFQLAGAGDSKLKVLEHNWQQTSNGFETTATLQTGNSLKQSVKITSLGDKAVLYEDTVTALSDVSIAKELGVPLGIENDRITGGTRTVYDEHGKTVFDWQNPQQPTSLPGSWANVDGRLGIIAIEGSGFNYTQAKSYSRGISVYSDILDASYSDQPRHFKAGDSVAHRVVLLLAELSPEQTVALAHSLRVEQQKEKKLLHFKLPEGGNADIQLQ
jgi:hypothetical protein